MDRLRKAKTSATFAVSEGSSSSYSNPPSPTPFSSEEEIEPEIAEENESEITKLSKSPVLAKNPSMKHMAQLLKNDSKSKLMSAESFRFSGTLKAKDKQFPPSPRDVASRYNIPHAAMHGSETPGRNFDEGGVARKVFLVRPYMPAMSSQADDACSFTQRSLHNVRSTIEGSIEDALKFVKTSSATRHHDLNSGGANDVAFKASATFLHSIPGAKMEDGNSKKKAARQRKKQGLPLQASK